MYAVFVRLWGSDADFLRPYALAKSVAELDSAVETLESYGVEYEWRQII